MQTPRGCRLGAALAAFLLLAPTATAAITVRGSTAAEAMSLGQAIVDQPGLLTSATWMHYPTPANSCNPNGESDATITGTFGAPSGRFGILTSGEVQLAPTANTATNSGCAMGDSFGGANDVSTLELRLSVPQGHNCLLLDFQFLSDEYPEYVGSNFNDAFIAELDTSTWTVSGATVSAPNNFAFDQAGNPITINSAGAASMNANNAAGSTYDGATARLTAQTPLSSAGSHRVYLTIFDASDHAYDSAVFIDNLRTGTISGASCVAGVVQASPPIWDIPPSPCGQTLSYVVGDTVAFGVQAASSSPPRIVTIANPTKPAGSTSSIGAPGNPTTASFSWTTNGVSAGTYTTQWTAMDDLGQAAPTCIVGIHLEAKPAPKLQLDGAHDRAGAFSGTEWGNWSAAPGALNVASNYLRITNLGNAVGTVTINFDDPDFVGPYAALVPITDNLRYCHATDPAAPPNALAFACQTPPPGSRAVTLAIPAGQRLWVYYELQAIPDPAPDGPYQADYSIVW
jgi:hypothetical protein